MNDLRKLYFWYISLFKIHSISKYIWCEYSTNCIDRNLTLHCDAMNGILHGKNKSTNSEMNDFHEMYSIKKHLIFSYSRSTVQTFMRIVSELLESWVQRFRYKLDILRKTLNTSCQAFPSIPSIQWMYLSCNLQSWKSWIFTAVHIILTATLHCNEWNSTWQKQEYEFPNDYFHKMYSFKIHLIYSYSMNYMTIQYSCE